MLSTFLQIKSLELILRVAVFMTFLGHGMFAIGGNANWLIYLQTVGFSIETSKNLIVIIGILDVIVAAIILLKPHKYVVLWAFVWAFSTAVVRPLAGESIWTFVERGSNWAVPLVLFFLLKVQSEKNNFKN